MANVGKRMRRRYFGELLGLLLAAGLSWLLGSSHSWAEPTSPSGSHWLAEAAQQLELEGQRQFAEGREEAALASLAEAIASYRSNGDRIGEAIASSNLASVYAELGRWQEANRAINASLDLLEGDRAPTSADRAVGEQQVLAQVLDTNGRLLFRQGRLEPAFDSWERAAVLFEHLRDESGTIRARINEAQALQSLGLYRRATAILERVVESLEERPDSVMVAVGLRSLGDALETAGDLDLARKALNDSLKVAERLQDAEAIAAAQLSLGNAARASREFDRALALYREAASGSPNSRTQLQALLNQLSLLVETEQWPLALQTWPEIGDRLDAMPVSRTAIYDRINLARSLEQLHRHQVDGAPDLAAIAAMTALARQQAREIDDPRAESHALGQLGEWYERTQQWPQATAATQTALELAQAHRDADIAYRWQWQLGRIQVENGQLAQAVRSYRAALGTLQELRGDLAAINPEIQHAFRDRIEPIHREFVQLLLREEAEDLGIDDPLEVARQTIESLQVAELDNFFRAACVDTEPIEIDTIDEHSAIIYPIVLPRELAIVLRLPGQPLQLFHSRANSAQIDRLVDLARLAYGQRNSPRHMPLSQLMYDWIVRPIEGALSESEVDTLVFVPDGVLRNLPMGAMHDGERYLLERYAIALSPGLQLLPPEAPDSTQVNVLIAGLSQPTQGFSGLPHVTSEVDSIALQIPASRLQDEDFTANQFKKSAGTESYPIVHIATHGQFSSQLDRTFLLTWDDKIDINQLRSLIFASDFTRSRPIDLLVLSACQTATGDRRAALGLAGIATRAGARSTLATFWQVNDESTATIMEGFYRNLKTGEMTKAEALRQAQISFLAEADRRHQHPFFWAAFSLIGNWL
ncbi:CHAT domain-containing protein [Synechococcus sp. PCC 7336]|uniref:CHAT domain-containing protein n=1 Tax=Synechococcus sp. PCC 7336 TaxID=195250 RepID=UPI000345C09A|nr:CHAT domain-containing protein [Synechococcus sp. PCC 7336]